MMSTLKKTTNRAFLTIERRRQIEIAGIILSYGAFSDEGKFGESDSDSMIIAAQSLFEGKERDYAIFFAGKAIEGYRIDATLFGGPAGALLSTLGLGPQGSLSMAMTVARDRNDSSREEFFQSYMKSYDEVADEIEAEPTAEEAAEE